MCRGFNYAFPGVFGKWPSLTLDQFRDAFPHKPCIGTEDASTFGTRGIYADDKEHGHVNAYDTQGDFHSRELGEILCRQEIPAGFFRLDGL